MKKCNYCHKFIKNLPYRCKYCGLLFCSEHRIPENHSCSYDIKNIGNSILYADALISLNQKLTIAKIYEIVTKKELSKKEAIKLLKHFIEYSDDIEDRVNSIAAFEILNLKNDDVYELLENCVISDTNPKVRRIAIKVLARLFPEKRKKLKKLKKSNI